MGYEAGSRGREKIESKDRSNYPTTSKSNETNEARRIDEENRRIEKENRRIEEENKRIEEEGEESLDELESCLDEYDEDEYDKDGHDRDDGEVDAKDNRSLPSVLTQQTSELEEIDEDIHNWPSSREQRIVEPKKTQNYERKKDDYKELDRMISSLEAAVESTNPQKGYWGELWALVKEINLGFKEV